MYNRRVPTYRICRRFTVEIGHMLRSHPGRCRFPHGHTRTVEVVVAASELDEYDMVLDFKALKLAVGKHIDRFDHAMAIHAEDPLRPAIESVYPESLVVFEHREPTTEAMAEEIFMTIEKILAEGFEGSDGDASYRIAPQQAVLERVRVWETPSCWAEVAE